MNTPVRPAITTCVQVTPPATPQTMTTFLDEELPLAVKRKTSFEIPRSLLERAFVEPAAYPGETVQEYANRHDVAKVDVHIPDVLSVASARLKHNSLLVNIVYELHAANMHSDFIQKATSKKGIKKAGKTGKNPEAEGPAEGVFLTSDRLQNP